MFTISNAAHKELMQILPILSRLEVKTKTTHGSDAQRRALKLKKYLGRRQPIKQQMTVQQLPSAVVEQVYNSVLTAAKEFANERPDFHYGTCSNEIELEIDHGRLRYYITARYVFNYHNERGNYSGRYQSVDVTSINTTTEVWDKVSDHLFPPFSETFER